VAWFNNETNIVDSLGPQILAICFSPFLKQTTSPVAVLAFPVWAVMFPIDGSCIMQMYPLLVVKPPLFWSESCRHL
jgi:4-hydroxybenzoate polyprenyltransferase